MPENKFITSDTTQTYRDGLSKKLQDIQDKKGITLVNWLGLIVGILTACGILLGGMVYIIQAENEPIRKDNESIKQQLNNVIEDVKEIKSDMKGVRSELKEVGLKVQTREQLKELASEVSRRSCIEYHLIRDKK